METMLTYRPRQMLCPIDLSALSDLALKYAYVGAGLFDATLTVLHAIHFDYPRYLSRELAAHVLAEVETTRAAARQAVESHVRGVLGPAADLGRLRYETLDRPPAEAILQTAVETAADLVVMGTHGYSGFKQWMLGSVAESVLLKSRVPVFTVRQKIDDFIDPAQPAARPRIGHILCPCNLTVAAGLALQTAAALAVRFQARLTAVLTLEADASVDLAVFSEWVEATVQGTLPVEAVLRRGEAAAETLGLTRELDCDLIVISARHQQFAQSTVVGRTTERVLRHAPVPVLAVPHYGEGT